MVIERRVLSEGWKSVNQAIFEFMSKPVEMKDVNVVVSYDPKYKVYMLYIDTDSLVDSMPDLRWKYY